MTTEIQVNVNAEKPLSVDVWVRRHDGTVVTYEDLTDLQDAATIMAVHTTEAVLEGAQVRVNSPQLAPEFSGLII